VENKIDDDTEFYEGELKEAIDTAIQAAKKSSDSN
jgi:hypothetical protein